MFTRKKIAAFTAELLGTAVLTAVVLAVVRSAIGIPYFLAIGVALTLSLLVLILGSASGAHVNPAVTFGLWTLRKINTADAVMYIVAQFIGALAAAKLYVYLTEQSLQNIANTEFDWRILIAELIGTFVFTFGIAAAVYQRYEGGKLAMTIGGSLGLGILVAGVASNSVLNPAVALGIQSWSMVYVAGPLLGAIFGMNLYALLFAGEKIITVKKRPIKKAATKSKSKTKQKKK